MSELAYDINANKHLAEVIQFRVMDGTGTKSDTKKSKEPTKSSEVYAFRSAGEISAMIDVFDRHIENAENDNQRQIAYRNKMLFVIGINIGIRASDLRTLKWSFFFNEDGSRKENYKIQPQKTRKHKKFVTLHFNNAVEKMIDAYVTEYPVDNLNEYLFASRVGDEPITVRSLWRIIKDAAREAGINQNIGSHSLRKSFGYWVWHNAEDKNKALVILQYIFNHSSVATTSRYIGITDDEISDTFNDLNLGIDMI